MRYSRFKSQMEPSSAKQNTRKRNTKKSGTAEFKGDIPASTSGPMGVQRPFPMSAPGPVLKMEPSDSHLLSSTYIKCEPGKPKNARDPAFTEMSDFQHHFQHIMSPNSMPYPSHISHYVPHELQYSITSGVSPPRPSLSLPHYESPYTSMPLSNEVNMHTFSLQQPAFHNAPVITWEPPAPAHWDSTPVKIEEELEIAQSIEFWDAPVKIEEPCKG